jgi:class 3 adenylate cyclase/TolB-like protein/Tfp pilus assembly protein PilF
MDYTMPEVHSNEKDFLQRITEVIEKNLSNEQFGVSELAKEIGMSRSSLLRKVKKITHVSVSQFIRELRLKRGMEMLGQTELTVSEISYKIGFNSTSYFVKCFREYYGYPPGEVGKNQSKNGGVDQDGQSHQLAAIMFTDIQGYTALMQQDEKQALAFRNRHREVFNATTKKFKGRILQYYGDGTLSTFQSAIDAVKCGIELQQAFQQAPSIPVRIGIHSGDIIFSADDIIGDGVNVASRIESLAAAGSVFISDKVYDEVKNQSGIQTTPMGTFELKNVDKPIEVFAIANPGLVIPEKDQIGGKVKAGLAEAPRTSIRKKRRKGVTGILIAALLLTVGYLINTTGIFDRIGNNHSAVRSAEMEKSIAVLPFINDSSDSSNVYIINGLMESILNHLQKIEGLRVISRTSVEQYRNSAKLLPEIGQELNVYYLVEGSGQKIGDQVLLNVQLIEAPNDNHLWSEQYNKEVTDIFGLQIEIAKKIADEIEVIITPEENAQIDKQPTDNLAAYDAYLKGREFFNQGNGAGLLAAIPWYEKAIELDPEFAHAHAGLAITYFFLDFNQSDKKYTNQINSHADKALLYDSELETSLIAKAVYYLQLGDYASALPHLEKALAYNPNSVLVLNILSDYYTRFAPDTKKYLEYALKATRLDIASQDSTTASYTYLHISNALIQSGFVTEAEKYINKSLSYDPFNIYSNYVKAFILYARDQDLEKTKILLLDVLAKDTTRLDVLQEVAKICYFMRDYDCAFKHYKRFSDTRTAFNLDMYRVEDIKIANVMKQAGEEAAANQMLQDFESYVTSDQSIYKPLNLAMIAAYKGDNNLALQKMREFSETAENFHYWILLFFKTDPLMDDLKELPEFNKIMLDLETKFWDQHEEVKVSLVEMGLI